jgi:hypothetical protein
MFKKTNYIAFDISLRTTLSEFDFFSLATVHIRLIFTDSRSHFPPPPLALSNEKMSYIPFMLASHSWADEGKDNRVSFKN